MEDCWQQDPKKCPTFQEIVERLGIAEFSNNSIDDGRFRADQFRVLL
jgi:hypothetical protein